MKMTLKFLFIIGLCINLLALTLIIITVIIANKKRKKIDDDDDNEIRKLRRRTSLVVIFCSCFMLLGTISLCGFISLNKKAIQHGAYNDEHYSYQSEDIFKVKHRINHTPIEESDKIANENSYKGYIIYLYRWSCGECEQINEPLNKLLKENDVQNFYHISSRSELGKTIVKAYGVTEVPCMIYFRQQGGYTIKYIKIDNGDHTASLNEDEVMRLIELQERGD